MGGWAASSSAPASSPAVRRHALAYALRHPAERVTIELGKLGPDAVTVGAAILPLADFFDRGGRRPDPTRRSRPRPGARLSGTGCRAEGVTACSAGAPAPEPGVAAPRPVPGPRDAQRRVAVCRPGVRRERTRRGRPAPADQARRCGPGLARGSPGPRTGLRCPALCGFGAAAVPNRAGVAPAPVGAPRTSARRLVRYRGLRVGRRRMGRALAARACLVRVGDVLLGVRAVRSSALRSLSRCAAAGATSQGPRRGPPAGRAGPGDAHAVLTGAEAMVGHDALLHPYGPRGYPTRPRATAPLSSPRCRAAGPCSPRCPAACPAGTPPPPGSPCASAASRAPPARGCSPSAAAAAPRRTGAGRRQQPAPRPPRPPTGQPRAAAAPARAEHLAQQLHVHRRLRRQVVRAPRSADSTASRYACAASSVEHLQPKAGDVRQERQQVGARQLPRQIPPAEDAPLLARRLALEEERGPHPYHPKPGRSRSTMSRARSRYAFSRQYAASGQPCVGHDSSTA